MLLFMYHKLYEVSENISVITGNELPYYKRAGNP